MTEIHLYTTLYLQLRAYTHQRTNHNLSCHMYKFCYFHKLFKAYPLKPEVVYGIKMYCLFDPYFRNGTHTKSFKKKTHILQLISMDIIHFFENSVYTNDVETMTYKSVIIFFRKPLAHSLRTQAHSTLKFFPRVSQHCFTDCSKQFFTWHILHKCPRFMQYTQKSHLHLFIRAFFQIPVFFMFLTTKLSPL